MSALLALSASLFWGGSDFLGGTLSRRLSPLTVTAWADAVVLVALFIAAIATGQLHFDPTIIGWGGAAGIAGLIGVLAFYRALADGVMGVVSPIAGLGVAIPVLVGVALGNRPDTAQIIGMVVGVIGIVLVSASGGSSRPMDARILGLAAVAAAGFGTYFVCVNQSEPHGTLMTLLMMRIAALAVILGIRVFGGRRLALSPRDLPLVSVIGGLDMLANGAFALATSTGQLAVVSVLSSLYPAVTALLARIVHDERLGRRQAVGVVAAIIAIVLLAAGPSA